MLTQSYVQYGTSLIFFGYIHDKNLIFYIQITR